MKMSRREYNKYYHDYIENVNLDNIEFKTFTYDELISFLKLNYYDSEFEKFVYWEPDGFMCPFGMYYLDFDPATSDYCYLLGTVDNSKNGKTIVFSMIYDNNFEPINETDRYGYLSMIETNYFFRNKGIFNRALEHLKEAFKNNNILVISPESLKGSEVEVFNKIKTHFGEQFLIITEDEYFESLATRQRW